MLLLYSICPAASIYYIVSYFHQFPSKSAASIGVICISINPSPIAYLQFVNAVRAYILVAKSAIIFSFGFAMMCGCPIIVVDATFALLVPFGAVLLHVMINGRLFVVINTHPPACHLAAEISHFSLWLV